MGLPRLGWRGRSSGVGERGAELEDSSSASLVPGTLSTSSAMVGL